MGLETATTISGLQSSNPGASDLVSQGDDHLRLIKSVLKAQFPGVGGQGFASAISAKEAEINYLVGVRSGIQAQIDAITAPGGFFPSGTVMMFFNVSPPPGWTRNTLGDGCMVVAGNYAPRQGIHDPTIMNFVPTHTHANTFNVSLVAAGGHTHDTAYPILASVGQPGGSNVNAGAVTGQAASTSNGGHNHTVNLTGSVTANAGTSWQPMYHTGIVAQKT